WSGQSGVLCLCHSALKRDGIAERVVVGGLVALLPRSRTFAAAIGLIARLVIVHFRIPLALLGLLHIKVNPIARLRAKPRNQFLALDGNGRLHEVRRSLMRGFYDKPVNELPVCHTAS